MNLINEKYLGTENREALIDLEIPTNFNQNIIVFIHGYMGFKDWGPWSLMQSYFVKRGFGFCKFNLTHNGTTPEHPIDFVDLEAFGNNCYTYEKNDLLCALDWLKEKIDVSVCTLHLLGHSRGGGIALLCAQDQRISSVITLASISSIEKRFDFEKETIKKWKKTGTRYVRNGRTNQDLPHNFSQYLDFQKNKKTLSIQTMCKSISKPLLFIHGVEDESISIEEGKDLSRWSKNQLVKISGASHTFGGFHPYRSKTLPPHLKECCILITKFIKKQQLEKVNLTGN